MELTEAQFGRIAPLLPVQRGNVSVPNIQVLNAILHVAGHGCKWRGLPERFGNWHTVYTRMNRWSKNGVLDRVFEHLQRERLVRVKIEAASLDSTGVKVHPDGAGAEKNGPQAIGKSRGGWTARIHMVAADDRTALAFSLTVYFSARSRGAASTARPCLGHARPVTRTRSRAPRCTSDEHFCLVAGRVCPA